MSAETLPAEVYFQQERYAKERAHIFGRSWLLLGHEQELPKQGDSLSRTIAGWSLLLVRGPHGIRAFHNVCRHRAAPLLWDGEHKNCKVLRCQYHGWRYDLDGALVEPWEHGGELPKDSGLFALQVWIWRGLIFVHLAAAPQDFEAMIAPFAKAAAEVPLDGWRLASARSFDLSCNWKVYVENYLEGYHIPWMHPSLAKEIVFKDYRVRVGEGYCVHEVSAQPHALNRGFWAWLWPNVAINVYEAGMSLERMVPCGPRTTRIEYLYFFKEGQAHADAEAMSQQVTQEDIRICEAVQRNLEGGVYQTGWLSPRHEQGVEAFQTWVKEAVALP